MQVDRARLRSDPGRALHQTQRIAESLTAIAPGQDYLIDNISNALSVARDDAAVGKRMFIFLGLPGVVLAAFLAAYAGHILATTQRRDQANLRLRGADRRQLGRVVGAQALAIAVAGSVVGTAVGLAAVAAILGRHTLFAASAGQLPSSCTDRGRRRRRGHRPGAPRARAAGAPAGDRGRAARARARPRPGVAPLAARPRPRRRGAGGGRRRAGRRGLRRAVRLRHARSGRVAPLLPPARPARGVGGRHPALGPGAAAGQRPPARARATAVRLARARPVHPQPAPPLVDAGHGDGRPRAGRSRSA